MPLFVRARRALPSRYRAPSAQAQSLEMQTRSRQFHQLTTLVPHGSALSWPPDRCRRRPSPMTSTPYQLPFRRFGHGHSHGGIVHNHDPEAEEAERAKLSAEDAQAADRITWIGIYTNVALTGVKGVAGVTFHSASLLADAVHSLSDLISDGVTLAALKYCARPPDALQPYGYGKYETMGALAVSLLLVGGSLGIINHSLETLMVLCEQTSAVAAVAVDQEVLEAVLPAAHEHNGHGAMMMLHPAALGIAAASIGAKEALYRITIALGTRIHSSVLIANAWHHRSDAISSIVAMGGIGLSLAGMPMFDPIGGMLVGGIILKMGGEIGWSAVKELCDAQLPDKIVHNLQHAVDGVMNRSGGEIVSVKQLRSRFIGRNVHVDLTLVLSDGLSFQQACAWKEEIKNAISREVPRAKDIIVELSTAEQSPSTVFETSAHDHDHHRHGHSH